MSRYDSELEDAAIYRVVVNHEEQYSIWPADRATPLGWRAVEKTGRKSECLSYIKEVWVDMRPLSLRKQMEERAKSISEADLSEAWAGGTETPPEDDLVTRLSRGDHPIEAELHPERTAEALKDRIDRGYVQLKFTGTRGGTGINLRLDREALDVTQADFNRGVGVVHLEGMLSLNFVKVRCIIDLDLSALKGKGRLAPVDAHGSI